MKNKTVNSKIDCWIIWSPLKRFIRSLHIEHKWLTQFQIKEIYSPKLLKTIPENVFHSFKSSTTDRFIKRQN